MRRGRDARLGDDLPGFVFEEPHGRRKPILGLNAPRHTSPRCIAPVPPPPPPPPTSPSPWNPEPGCNTAAPTRSAAASPRAPRRSPARRSSCAAAPTPTTATSRRSPPRPPTAPAPSGSTGSSTATCSCRSSRRAQGAFSKVVRAYVFPRPKSTFKALDGGRLRITQILRTPANIKLSAKTNFYLGPKNAKSARAGGHRASRKKIGKGRFKAAATVKLPPRWKGSFRYGSCFRYSEGSGLGDPGAQLP